MLNQLVLVGRIKNKPTNYKKEEKLRIGIEVKRNYKNENGEYDTDLIHFEIDNSMAENVFNYCKIGDIIGVKGRLETKNNTLKIIPDKITYLSSKAKES